MPELPEVEVIVRELNSKLNGEKIIDIKSLWTKSLVLNGQQMPFARNILSVTRKGKFIIINLDEGNILIHLRMTGQLVVTNSDNCDMRHLRVIINFESGKKLLFYDTRKFGRIYLSDNLGIFFSNFGVDALSPELNNNYLKDLFSRRKARIKSLLMDQRYIAGLGNIYIDESLFRAGIHPSTAVHKLSYKKIVQLHGAIREILEQAILNMGTTISNYITTGGGFGNNQFFLRVYGRENESCYTCGSKIMKIRINNRGTHFCPKCQPVK